MCKYLSWNREKRNWSVATTICLGALSLEQWNYDPILPIRWYPIHLPNLHEECLKTAGDGINSIFQKLRSNTIQTCSANILSFLTTARTSSSDGGFVSTNRLGGVAAARTLSSELMSAGGKFRADSKCSCHLERISLAEEHDVPSSFLTGAGAEFTFLPARDLMARYAGRRLFCFESNLSLLSEIALNTKLMYLFNFNVLRNIHLHDFIVCKL